MPVCFDDLLRQSVERYGDKMALSDQRRVLSFSQLGGEAGQWAALLTANGVGRGDRVLIFAAKRVELVTALLGCSAIGAVFVLANPALKQAQLGHMVHDCEPALLIVDRPRQALANRYDVPVLDLETVTAGQHASLPQSPAIDADMAGLFYTSGSTGQAKGVIVTHRNLVAGAKSVSSYLTIGGDDRILALLPLSFDYGFNQLSCALLTGASAHLFDYLLPGDVPKIVAKQGITILAGVPPLWHRLAALAWPEEVLRSLRLVTNSGGHMPRPVLNDLRAALPHTDVVLMYGLTEAFRSTYLPSPELDRRPDSMGKPIPGAELAVIRDDGSRAAPGEEGELIHRGVHVTAGYWHDAPRTDRVFRPWPFGDGRMPMAERAVFTGDRAVMDEEGYFYHRGRADEQIKSSGYRISPTEVEEVLLAHSAVREVAAFGVPDPSLGEAVAVIMAADQTVLADIQTYAAAEMPAYMQPRHWHVVAELPRNPNGKVDRAALKTQLSSHEH